MPGGQGGMHVPAIRFVGQQLLEIASASAGGAAATSVTGLSALVRVGIVVVLLDEPSAPEARGFDRQERQLSLRSFQCPPSTGGASRPLPMTACATFEFGIVVEVFGLPRPELRPAGNKFQVCALEKGDLRGRAA